MNELYYDPELLATSPKTSLLLANDNSSSMGVHIDVVKQGIKNVLSLVEEDDMLKGNIQTCITSFNNTVNVLKYPNESTNVTDQIENLRAFGGTSMHDAYCVNAQYLLHSIKEQQKMGCVFNGALMVFFTDGCPTDLKTKDFDTTKQYLNKKGIKTIAIGTDGANFAFLEENFDLVIPITDINRFPQILKSLCKAILPAVSQSRPGDSLKFKFATNDGNKVLEMNVQEIEIEDNNPIIDVRG